MILAEVVRSGSWRAGTTARVVLTRPARGAWPADDDRPVFPARPTSRCRRSACCAPALRRATADSR
jgi:hypothetical protein